MQRSLLLFQNSIHSEETYRVYKYCLDKFIEHFKLRDYNALVSMDSKMFQEMVEDYVMFRKSKGRSRTTINSSICSLQLFCETNDIELRWRKIRRLLPPQKKRSGSKAYTTEQVRKVLDFTPESLYKRYKKKVKYTLKTDKKTQQDLGKSLYGIVKDFFGF